MARVATSQVDASNSKSLLEAFSSLKATLVIVASSTLEYVDKVTEAAIKAKVDYIDIQLSSKAKTDYLHGKEPEITAAGLCFITDGGFHPGLPAALIRYIAPSFDKLEKANVGSIIQAHWDKFTKDMSVDSAGEFAGKFVNMQLLAYTNSE